MAKTVVSDLVAKIFDTMDYSIEVTGVSAVSGNYVLATKETLHATEGRTIKDASNNTFLIKSVVNNESITVLPSGATTPFAGTFTLPKMYFKPGTPVAVNNETSIEQELQQTVWPLAWMLEIMQIQYDYDPESTVDCVPNLTIYFLHQAEYEDWTTLQHKEKIIKPMSNIAHRFISECIKSKYFDYPEGRVEFIEHAKFGLNFTNPKTNDRYSHMKNIVNDKVSGVQVRMKIPILKQC